MSRKLSKRGRERIKELIRFMKALNAPGTTFNMGNYFDNKDALATEACVTGPALVKCNSSACALGWASLDPVLQLQGLEPVRHGDSWVPGYKDQTMDGAAYAFFGLDYDQEYFLFGAHTDVKTPQQWAERAERWLRKQK